MKRVLVLLSLLPVLGFAQRPEVEALVDSLRKELGKTGHHDTTRIRLMSRIGERARIYRVSYWDSIADETQNLSSKYEGTPVAKKLEHFYITAMNNVGIIEFNSGNQDAGIEAMKKSLMASQRLKDTLEVATMQGNLGMMCSRIGRTSESLGYLQQSLQNWRLIGDDVGIARALNSIAICYSNLGDLEQAVNYYHESLKLRESAGDKQGEGNSLNNLGTLYDTYGDYEKSLEQNKKALWIYKEIGYREGEGITYTFMASTFLKMKQPEKALEYHRRGLTIWHMLKRLPDIGTAYHDIGHIHEVSGNHDSAMYYFTKGLAILEQTQDIPRLTTVLYSLGNAHYRQEQYPEALTYGMRSLDLARRIGFPKKIDKAARLLSQVYTKTGKYKDAFEMFQLHVEMRDSVINEANQKATVRQQTQYDFEKQKAKNDAEHEKQLALEQEAQARQRVVIIASVCGLMLVIAFLIFVFNRLKVTRKQKGIIEEAHLELEEKNTEIMDSIQYARRIQGAILPPPKLVKEYLQDSFVLYIPKDIVAGDFYWMETVGDSVLFAAADCTGHGVPGAMVSVMCSTALTKAVKEEGLSEPAAILDKAVEYLEAQFEKSEEVVSDGMDLALCKLNTRTRELEYSGANNPLWIIPANAQSGDDVQETKANKQPVGKFDHRVPFVNHKFQMNEGDTLYIFSDGYVDQFGGEKGKKFKSKPFKRLLVENNAKSMEEIRDLIHTNFENWRGPIEQIDDVCVIGVRV